jgi:hypothetical protein
LELNAMNLRPWAVCVLVCISLIAKHAIAETTFTYQGRLGNAGTPAEGQHDFVFRLFDAEANGVQIGSDLALGAVELSEGVFSVSLDFGDAAFAGQPRWLEIDVRESGAGAYTTLSPRQRIGASPFAIETLRVAPGSIDTAALQDGAVTQAKLANDSVGSAQIASGAVRSAEIFDGSIVAADIADQAVSRSRIKLGAVGTEQIEDGSITSADLGIAAVDTVALGDDAVTQAKLAENSVGTSQIQNNTVSSADIRDGAVSSVDIQDASISTADIAAGIYRSRADLYEVIEGPISVGILPQNQTVSCNDANDLPVFVRCGSESINSFLSTHLQPLNWTDTATPAASTCTAVNVHPSNPSSNPVSVTISIVCVSVP